MSCYRPFLLSAAGLLLAAWPAGGGFAAPVKRAVKGPAAAAKPAPRPAAGAPAATEAAAIAAVEKLGGRVQEVAQNDNHLEVSYHLSGASVTDASLVPLARLKRVVHLDLGQTAITDAGLAHVRALTELTDLHLEGTKVTDRGLASLKGLVNLTYLNLYGTAVTDAGLDQLTGLTKLRHIYVWQTKVTDAGASKLKKALPQLEVVTGIDLTPAPAPPKAAPAAQK